MINLSWSQKGKVSLPELKMPRSIVQKKKILKQYFHNGNSCWKLLKNTDSWVYPEKKNHISHGTKINSLLIIEWKKHNEWIRTNIHIHTRRKFYTIISIAFFFSFIKTLFKSLKKLVRISLYLRYHSCSSVHNTSEDLTQCCVTQSWNTKLLQLFSFYSCPVKNNNYIIYR